MECGIGNVEQRTENREWLTQKAMRTLTMTRAEEVKTNATLSDLLVAPHGHRRVPSAHDMLRLPPGITKEVAQHDICVVTESTVTTRLRKAAKVNPIDGV